MKLAQISLLVLSLLLSTTNFGQEIGDIDDIERNTKLIDQYILFDGESLPSDDVLALASDIIRKRQYYDKLVLAKTYILLADVAIDKGDMARALQFAQDGYGLNIYDGKTQLNLLLKIAAAQYSQSNFTAMSPTISKILELANNNDGLKYRLLALAYRAVAYALTNETEQAIADMQFIESLLTQNEQYNDHTALLEILAKANFYLANYDASIALQLRILNLRWQFAKTHNISTTYYQLASAYRKLDRLDDAYDAFWQARETALTSKSKIRQAYAELGLGDVLYHQGEYPKALAHLNLAEQLFTGQNLMQAYVSTLIVLAKTHTALDQTDQAAVYLLKAEKLDKDLESHIEHIDLYELLADFHFNNGDIDKAWVALNQYLKLYQQRPLSYQNLINSPEIDQALNKKRQLTLNISEKNELHAQYSERLNEKNNTIQALFFCVILLTLLALGLAYQQRRHKLDIAYQEDEVANDQLPNNTQTKRLYQKSYKMARKYQFTLSVSYLTISNWNELTFRSSKKEVAEVQRTIASVINEYIGEFDTAGLLSNGEYLLMFPHQAPEDVRKLVIALCEALKVRFFANLGEVVVNINFALDDIKVQDIDPFIFLSRLTEIANGHITQDNK